MEFTIGMALEFDEMRSNMEKLTKQVGALESKLKEYERKIEDLDRRDFEYAKKINI